MGMGAGNSLAQTMNEPFNQTPLKEAPTTQNSLASRLMQLKELYEQELISEEEYTAKKLSILSEL